MIDVSEKSFLGAAKGKIITGFVLAFFALFLAWAVSKIAFNEMLDTVDTISTPNAKLRLVNHVSRKVASLDQQQRTTAFNSPGKYSGFLKDSRQLRILLDSLGGMYLNDPVQLNRIKSIEKLLVARDKQFVNYLKVREGLVNNKSFTDEVQKLNEMVNRPPQQQDSTIVTTEKKTSTVTILPVDESKRKGFLSRIFSKKNDSPEQNKSYQVTNEEKIKRDTIALSGETIIAKGLEKSLRTIASEQRLRSARFLDREAVLANANNALTRQMLDILRKVESEVVAQIEQNGIQAKAVVNTGITRISWIMIGFFLLTVILLYLILTDITRSNLYRKELEAARDEAEYHGMAKQRFLSNMSHEIRTPLQSIIGYAEIIRNQEHPQHKDIEAIFHSSEHLLQIVNEILDYNRIISGKFTFQRKPFNIKDLLEEVVSVMKPQAEQKQLTMRTAIELHGIEFIEGDAFRLKQILYNLLSNAVKFTQKGEVVLTVYYKRQLGNLHFTFMVKDTGIGFSEEENHRIFNEFEQIDSADKEVINKAGAGLGLTIIKSLVENQDGRIYVKSKAGTGSTFTVYLTFKAAMATREGLRPGGRSARVQESVHTAVSALLAEIPRDDITVPQIAVRAGVTPSTIYRRWGDLHTLLADVAVQRFYPDAEPMDLGSLKDDLAIWAQGYQEEMSSAPGRAMMRDVMAGMNEDGAGPACRCSSITRAHVQLILDRAAARGEPVPDADDVVNFIAAPVMYRLLFADVPLRADFARERVTMMLAGRIA